MYSPKFFYILVLVTGLFTVAALFRLSQLLFVSLPIMTYFILSSTGCKNTAITAKRGALPEKMIAGNNAQVKITLSVDDTPPLMEIADKVSSARDGYFLVKGDENVRLNYERKVNRGFVEIGPTRVRIENFSRTLFYDYKFQETARISVLPQVTPLQVRMSSRLTSSFYGPVPARKAGIGEEFYSLRNYLPGDEYRMINWKATARGETIVTNEYEAERVAEAVIVVDSGKHTELGRTKSLLDYQLEAAASIARVLLAEGHKVGVFAYSDYFHWIFPGTTKRHFIKILDVFTAITPAGFFRMQYVSRYVAAYARKGSQVIIISSMEDPRASETVEELSLMGYDVMVISPSPESIEWEEISHNKYTEIARKILIKKRDLMFVDLNRFSHAVNWDVSLPLEHVLQVVEKWLRKRRR